MARTTIDGITRALFKEWARRIIANDRAARKYGRSQNTIGVIERALVDAFQMGQAGFTPSPQNETIINWIEIPPRGRDVLWSISLSLRSSRVPSEEPIMLETVIVEGRKRWRHLNNRGGDLARTFSTGGVHPLVKMGLLDVVEDQHDQLVLSTKGVATCKDYWRRWDEGDPTLPVMSIRP